MNKLATKTEARVLLVDDDAVDRLACRRALTQHPDYDFHVIEAETARQGMQLLHVERPDVVLLDYRLPDQDGLEFLADLKFENGKPVIPVLMLTGSDDVGVAVAAMKRGARDYLVKDNAREYLALLPAVVERALREQRLQADKRAAEAKYRTLVEQIPAIVYVAALDVPGQVLYISPQVRALGYTPEKWLAEGLLTHVHVDDRDGLVDAIVASCSDAKPLRCEYRLLTRSGETRWFLDEATVVRDAPGAPLFLQGTLVDITAEKQREEELQYHRRRLEELVAKRTAQLERQTQILSAANANLVKEIDERQRAERALRDSEERVRALVENAPDGIFIADLDGRYVEVNDAGCRMLGYARDEIIGKTILDLIPPEEAAPLLQSREQMLVGRTHVANWHLCRKDGTYLPVEVSAKILTDGRWQGFVRDTTERDQAERALRASEGRFRLLLESAGEGIYGLDAEGRCTFVNDAALEMLGYTREELLGRDTHSLLHQNRDDGTPLPEQECRVCDALRRGVSSVGVIESFRRKDGTAFPAEYSARPIREHDTITGAVLLFRDVTEAQALARRLAHQATHDALTGLVNRQEFERRLARVLGAASDTTGTHVLCYLDLDQFKAVNDSGGHAAGDELLRQVSALLFERMRARDTVSRLGGDEFGILLEHCPLDQALRIANEIRDAIGHYRFKWQELVYSIGVSIGVVELSGAIGTPPSAMRAADAACYAAKDKGRNRVEVYRAGDAEPDAHEAQMHWVARLTQALGEDRFELCHQSIAPLAERTAQRPHYEILLRLLDEHGRRVEPAAFLPAAERHNLMPSIDRWVLRNALAGIAARHRGTPREAWPIYAINIASSTLDDPGLAALIGTLLAEHGVPGGALCIEIKGTAGADNLARASAFVHELKKLGCLLALDNFGGGLHSLAGLKSLPLDFLKIDGSFIRGIAQDGVVRAIADAINRVAHVMAIQTVAECAEDSEVLKTLRELGVDHAQGYAIMNPQPLTQPPDATRNDDAARAMH